MKSLLLFILKAGMVIGIALGLASLGWIVYAETFASPSQALQGASTPLGQLWFSLHTGSLNLFQSLTQRYVAPEVWDFILLPTLLQPLWLFSLLTLGGNTIGLIITSFLSQRHPS